MHRWLFVGLALMAAVGGVGSALVSGNHPENPKLGLELIAMSRETSAGGFVVETGVNGGGPFARPTIPDLDELRDRIKTAEEIEAEHEKRLKEIVEEYGWPGKRLVGADGARAALELLRRVDDIAFQRRALTLMMKLPRGQVEGRHIAMVADGIALQQRQPQVYGTQFGCDEGSGKLEVVNGVVDPDRVDERRAEIGLPPFSEELKTNQFRFGACGFGEAPQEAPELEPRGRGENGVDDGFPRRVAVAGDRDEVDDAEYRRDSGNRQ